MSLIAVGLANPAAEHQIDFETFLAERRARGAHWTHGLEAAAQIAGHYVFHHGWRQGIVAVMDFATVAAESDIVALVRPVHHTCYISRDRQTITSEFLVDIVELLRNSGNEPLETATVVISIPGGIVEFENGTSAELRVTGFAGVQDGRRYVVGLVKEDVSDAPPGMSMEDAKTRYRIAWQTDGIFEVPEGSQRARDLYEPPLFAVRELAAPTGDGFLKAVRRATAEVSQIRPRRRK